MFIFITKQRVNAYTRHTYACDLARTPALAAALATGGELSTEAAGPIIHAPRIITECGAMSTPLLMLMWNIVRSPA